jgi:hypothetical protein
LGLFRRKLWQESENVDKLRCSAAQFIDVRIVVLVQIATTLEAMLAN